MGKTQRSSLLKKSILGHKGAKTTVKLENPFDKFANSRKKHEILNRKVKGEDRNVGRARAKAIDERKKKLLSDYKSNKKSNKIIDKRFGENDPTISLEEKMFMRFQRDRLKKVRNSSIFNLDSNQDGGSMNGEEEYLTHKGSILGKSISYEHTTKDWSDEEDSDNEDKMMGGKIHKDVVNKLHFGGGLIQKNRGDEEERGERGERKSRLDVLQEIVMKSKYYKMQRKEAKDEQESERKRLDEAFDDLFSSQLVEYKDKEEKRRNKERSADDLLKAIRKGRRTDNEEGENIEGGEEEDDYDRAMHEMMFEPKVQPSNRTKSAEELALETKEKYEELEKARLKRMKQARLGGRDLEDRKSSSLKRKRDDELDDMDFGKERNAKRGNESDDEEDEDEDDDDDDDEDDDEEEEEEDSGGEDGEGKDYSLANGSDEDEDEDEDDYDDEVGDSEQDDDDDVDLDSFDENDDEGEIPRKKRIADKDLTKKLFEEKDNVKVFDTKADTMPHKITCPNDIHSFDELLRRYCRSVDDNIELVRRIIGWNSIHLPGDEGKENKKLIHNFLDILLKHFMRIGDSLGSSVSEKKDEDTMLEVSVSLSFYLRFRFFLPFLC
jgi:nucleolar protein 14